MPLTIFQDWPILLYLGLSKRKKNIIILNIRWIKIKRMQKRWIRILGLHQPSGILLIGARNATTMQASLHFKLFCQPIQLNPLDVMLLSCSFNISRKMRCWLRQNWNQVINTECTFITFSRGSAWHSRLAQETGMFRKPSKMNVSTSVFPHPTVFKWRKLPTLWDWFLLLCIEL